MIRMSEVAHMYKLSLKHGHPETVKVLHGLLLHGLGEKQRETLGVLASSNKIRCMEVARQMNISRNNAYMTLARLAEYGLVKYEKVVDEQGVHYEWQMPNGYKD